MENNYWINGIGLICVVIAGILVFHLVNEPFPIEATASPSQTASVASVLSTPDSTTTATSSSPTPKVVASNTVSAVATTSTPTANVQAQSAQQLSTSGSQLLKSLVNIVCLSNDPSIPSISGSGVIIDSRGIILTVAHVAQLFLLEDYLGQDKVQCIVRTGSPARRAYIAKPIYVSKSWIDNNPSTLTSKDPKGTGQYDVALLAITDTATTTPLPSSFPHVPLTKIDTENGEQVAIGSYGAQYLTNSELNYSLYPILVFGSIQNRYTFQTGSVDVINVQGSAAAQEGSSGGGIVNNAGELVGTISTSAINGTVTDRLLNAITPAHLRTTYQLDTGRNLDSTLANESISLLISGFAAEDSVLGAELDNDIQTSGQ